VGVPRFADVVQDVNGDAMSDLVLPNGDKLDLWIQQPMNATQSGNAAQSGAADGSSAPPTFKRAASVHVQITSGNATENDELSRVLVSDFSIPRLLMLDVNGDGRPDLCVKDGDVRSFHIVAPDGSIPEKPDVSVDLSIFRDTTPEAGIRVGRTLPGGDKAHYESRDLDADGIPDYVIAHRRKVWVFHGTKKGPQFTGSSTIWNADHHVTALLLADLDGDKYPDLVLFKVQVPSLAAILRGLLREWEVEIDAAGYKNLAGKTFDTKPAWKSALYLRLPAILSMVRDPQSLIHRFEEVGRKFRAPTEADFDGDGKKTRARDRGRSGARDLAWARAIAADGARVERGPCASPCSTIRSAWDIDRDYRVHGGFAERRTQLLTGDRRRRAHRAARSGADSGYVCGRRRRRRARGDRVVPCRAPSASSARCVGRGVAPSARTRWRPPPCRRCSLVRSPQPFFAPGTDGAAIARAPGGRRAGDDVDAGRKRAAREKKLVFLLFQEIPARVT
jgi:hypothetical protein